MSTEGRTDSLWCTWRGLLLSDAGPRTHVATGMHLRQLLNQVRHKGARRLCFDLHEGKADHLC